MRIAILGATSQIAKDLIVSYSLDTSLSLHLFARRPDDVKIWLDSIGLTGRHPTKEFSELTTLKFDVIINFVGSGNPAQTSAMGASIFDVTLQYDQLAINYLLQHPNCRYLFLSSGAAFGSSFDKPVNEQTKATVAINDLKPQDWYAVAKLYAECRHRSLPELAILDIRVFNYFSRTLDINSRFLITDILRAIRDKVVLKTSPDFIMRDFLHPSDFYQLIRSVLAAPATNTAIDCYTLAPIDKPTLLTTMQLKFGLQYEITAASTAINATGSKPHYYSLSRRAADFGYAPSLTSQEGITLEVDALLKETKRQAGIK
jgi:nucleoside-diphosphate-sugar epimerase